jgi:hypothetical protein
MCPDPVSGLCPGIPAGDGKEVFFSPLLRFQKSIAMFLIKPCKESGVPGRLRKSRSRA